ncbi:hypothetical protein ACI77F_07590 [Pseudomonas tritici]|uniref:hypothetical protein n=1 Tax=Pseudomonas tritici TaxID=2745518 RepID=UPI00387B3A38
MTDKMREEFEEWAAEESEVRGVGTLLGLMTDEHNDRYSMIWTQTAWMAWQASRKALVVDLPAVGPSPEPPEDAIDDSFLDAHHAKIQMRNACFKAIDAAGITIKP